MSTKFRLKNHLLLAALAAAYPVLGYTAPAARIEFASGNVMAVSSAGQRPLARGSELNTGETINTGDGRAQLRFADGAMMSLQPQTEFRIDDYNYNGKNDGQEKGFFSLLRGGLRTISGYIGKGNRDAYKVTTSVATIGIRGTEWTGSLVPGASPEETELTLNTGEGAIEACNASGCITIAGGEAAVVIGNNQPRRTNTQTNLPPASRNNAQPPQTTPYSSAEDRNQDGSLVIVEENKPTVTPFTSGSGFAIALTGRLSGSSPFGSTIGDGTATFDPITGKLTVMEGGNYKYSATGDVTMGWTDADKDAVIGWGTWTAGDYAYNGLEARGSGTSLTDVHFVIGKATPLSELTATGMQEMTGTYALKSASTPSSTRGGNDSTNFFSGTLQAHFNAAGLSVDLLNMLVTVPNKTYKADIYGMTLIDGTAFSGGNYSSDGSNSWVSVQGLFAGKGGAYAGVSYYIDDTTDGGHLTNGAAIFHRDEPLRPNLLSSSTPGAYDVAVVANYDGPFLTVGTSTNTIFAPGSKLSQVEGIDNVYTYRNSGAADNVKDVGVMLEGTEAVLGWGRWTSGEKIYSGTSTLADVHYVVGKPMTAGDISSLNGQTGVFTAVAGTRATSDSNSMLGTLQSAKLTVNFGASQINSTSLDLKVKFNGNEHTFTNQWGYGEGGGKFRSSDSIEYRGFVAAGGKKAGITYSFDGGNDGNISGAAGFNRTNKYPTGG
jgi:hypothetical protein